MERANLSMLTGVNALRHDDRNSGNIVWTRDWKMWLIDHTRAFRLGKDLMKPELLQRCDRALLAAMRGLTADGVKKAVGNSLTIYEIEAVVARAEAIVKHFERREGIALTHQRDGQGPSYHGVRQHFTSAFLFVAVRR